MEPKVGKCDVCVLVHERHEEKPVSYCSLCDSWICSDCRGAWTWRAIAAVKKLLGVKK